MSNVVIGVVTIVVGALFCFRGNVAIRIVMAVWGAFAGFWLGAGAVAALTGAPLLAGPLGWAAAVLVALLAGSLAYGFYVLAVVIGFGGFGAALGTGVAAALGAGSGLTLVAAGVGAVLLVALALASNLPFALLVLLSATAGAGAITAGLQVLLGVVTPGADAEAIQDALAGQWWWTLVYLALAVAGVVVQLRGAGRADARSQWRQAPVVRD